MSGNPEADVLATIDDLERDAIDELVNWQLRDSDAAQTQRNILYAAPWCEHFDFNVTDWFGDIDVPPSDPHRLQRILDAVNQSLNQLFSDQLQTGSHDDPNS